MRYTFPAALLIALVATSVSFVGARADTEQRQAKPRAEAERQQKTEGKDQAQPPAERQRRPPETEASGRAQPRSEAPPERAAEPRSPSPPPRALPPRYHRLPRVYSFPPVSLQRGFYYHPYFGFYYGPYYGPFYPHPGPYFGQGLYGTSAIRTQVKPVDTQVYINGYYAGLVDDFDGVFQRLYVPAGQHEIELRLEGFRTHRQKLYSSPGDTLEISHQMQPLRPGEMNDPVTPPRTIPPEWTDPEEPIAGQRPASPFGILAIRVEPVDARIFVDGEAWVAMEGRPELVIHVEAGWHRLEVRKDGYQTFRTEVELSEGATTRLNVSLAR